MLCMSLDQWEVQPMVKRIVAELQRREYLVWFDRKCRMYTRLSVMFIGSDSHGASCSGAYEGFSDGAF